MKGRKRNGQFDRENTFASAATQQQQLQEKGLSKIKKRRRTKPKSSIDIDEKTGYHQKIYLDIAKHFFSKAVGIMQDENKKAGLTNLKKVEFVQGCCSTTTTVSPNETSVFAGKTDQEIREILEGSTFLEDQEQMEFEKDDDIALKLRYQKYLNGHKLSNGWLNYDYVFKNRTSHIFISQKDFLTGVGESFKDGNGGEGSTVLQSVDSENIHMKIPIPGNIVCLKMKCKNMWNLYKKRECERRRRFRKRITKYLQDIITKENVEKSFGHDEEEKTLLHSKMRTIVNDLKVENLLKNQKFVDKSINLLQYSEDFMKIVSDRCEECNNLFLSMNLFWGRALCDGCYFNPHVVIKTMIQVESELIMLKEKIQHPDYKVTKDPGSIAISEEEIKKATEDFDSFLQTFMKQNGLTSESQKDFYTETTTVMVEEDKGKKEIQENEEKSYEEQMNKSTENVSVDDIICETPLPFDGINVFLEGDCDEITEDNESNSSCDIQSFPFTF